MKGLSRTIAALHACALGNVLLGCQSSPRGPAPGPTPAVAVPSEPRADRSDAIVQLLERAPAWADLPRGDSAESKEALATLQAVSRYESEEIREAVERYCARHKDVSALSTIYVLNRLLFNVPDVVPRACYVAFGGWGDVPEDERGISGIWPLTRGPGNRLVLTGGLRAFMGPRYDAVGEFAYMNARYGWRRQD